MLILGWIISLVILWFALVMACYVLGFVAGIIGGLFELIGILWRETRKSPH